VTGACTGRRTLPNGSLKTWPLIERILAQSHRRVLDGQAVPAGEKLVSLFEPHADIILKGARDVHLD
jgi:IS5 family transposase